MLLVLLIACHPDDGDSTGTDTSTGDACLYAFQADGSSAANLLLADGQDAGLLVDPGGAVADVAVAWSGTGLALTLPDGTEVNGALDATPGACSGGGGGADWSVTAGADVPWPDGAGATGEVAGACLAHVVADPAGAAVVADDGSGGLVGWMVPADGSGVVAISATNGGIVRTGVDGTGTITSVAVSGGIEGCDLHATGQDLTVDAFVPDLAPLVFAVRGPEEARFHVGE
jgi:hypothetical protein